MKITLEPTGDAEDRKFYTYVSLEVDGNELNIEEMGQLFRQALLAWSYPSACVDELLPPE